MPLVIRPPTGRGFGRRGRPAAVSDAAVGNVDFAPTILAAAGAKPCRGARNCRRMDGRSLLGLLRGREPRWADSRGMRIGFFINASNYALSCRWQGIRTSDDVLIRHTELPASDGSNLCVPSAELEHYDRSRDPFQLNGAFAKLPRGLRRRLDRVADCSGIRKRDRRIKGTPYCE